MSPRSSFVNSTPDVRGDIEVNPARASPVCAGNEITRMPFPVDHGNGAAA
jgi:hypothetical protein